MTNGIPLIYKPSNILAKAETLRDTETTDKAKYLSDQGYDKATKALEDMAALSSDDDDGMMAKAVY